MKVDVYNQKGEKVGSALLPKEIFEVPLNQDVVHQAVLSQLATSRLIHAKTKTRAEVRGGGRKPWRQKGTGRARHGSRRSPLWIGGGTTFGPTTEKNYAKKINKKMKRKALFMVLSRKAKDDEIILLDELTLQEPKTKRMAEVFSAFASRLKKAQKETVTKEEVVSPPTSKNKKAPKTQKTRLPSSFTKTLVVLPERDEVIVRAAKNLPYADTLRADSLNVVDLLSHKYLLIPKASVKVIERVYARSHDISQDREGGENV